jgi:hypothetical protein
MDQLKRDFSRCAQWASAGLPDFSWYKIPKQEKYTKLK